MKFEELDALEDRLFHVQLTDVNRFWAGEGSARVELVFLDGPLRGIRFTDDMWVDV